MITRIAPVDFGIHASLTTQGTVNLSVMRNVNGNDKSPRVGHLRSFGASPAWCSGSGGNVTESGNGSVQGNPPIVNDPTVNNNTFTRSVGRRMPRCGEGDDYRSRGELLDGPRCDRRRLRQTVLTNWGDGINPLGQCASYFPIIHAAGTITLNNTQGQGILLVDGDLNIQGSYQFFGIVIIQGDLKTAGGGSNRCAFLGWRHGEER